MPELTDKLEGALYMFFSKYHLPHLAAGTVFGYSDEQKGVLKRFLGIEVFFLSFYPNSYLIVAPARASITLFHSGNDCISV